MILSLGHRHTPRLPAFALGKKGLTALGATLALPVPAWNMRLKTLASHTRGLTAIGSPIL